RGGAGRQNLRRPNRADHPHDGAVYDGGAVSQPHFAGRQKWHRAPRRRGPRGAWPRKLRAGLEGERGLRRGPGRGAAAGLQLRGHRRRIQQAPGRGAEGKQVGYPDADFDRQHQNRAQLD
nr:hypothetical protein [Tanacetum cinerariifolium]